MAVYGSTNNSNFTSLTLPVFSSVAANTPTLLGPMTVQVPVGATNLRVGVFSIYNTTNSTVALTLDTTYALGLIANATSFGNAFGQTNEATIATDIEGAAGGNAAASLALETFFNTYSGDFPLVNNGQQRDRDGRYVLERGSRRYRDTESRTRPRTLHLGLAGDRGLRAGSRPAPPRASRVSDRAFP